MWLRGRVLPPEMMKGENVWASVTWYCATIDKGCESASFFRGKSDSTMGKSVDFCQGGSCNASISVAKSVSQTKIMSTSKNCPEKERKRSGAGERVCHSFAWQGQPISCRSVKQQWALELYMNQQASAPIEMCACLMGPIGGANFLINRSWTNKLLLYC